MAITNHQKKLIRELEQYARRYPNEANSAARFVEFVSRNPECFDRNLPEGHITGSAWLLDETGDRVLLTHHAKLHKWLQLGGHCEGERSALEASLREAKEESGLECICARCEEIFDIDCHIFPEKNGFPEHYHYDVRFLLQASNSEQIEVSAESNDLRWVDINSIQDYTTEKSMLRMAEKSQEARASTRSSLCDGGFAKTRG